MVGSEFKLGSIGCRRQRTASVGAGRAGVKRPTGRPEIKPANGENGFNHPLHQLSVINCISKII